MRTILLIIISIFICLGVDAQKLTPIQDDNTRKWGFVDETGTLVINSVLDQYYSQFWNGIESRPSDFATVKYRGKWGCINKQGEFVVKPVFGAADEAHTAGNLWEKRGSNNPTGTTIVSLATKSQIIPKENKVVHKASTTPSRSGNISPKIKIISPSSGSDYHSASLVIKYEVKTSGNIPYDLSININGERIDAATMKGVKRASNEISLTLPRKSEKMCNVQLVAKDANGNSSEPVTISLNYVGDKSKPNLLIFAVGVSEYQEEGLKLKNAANDARDFISTLKARDNSLYESVKVSSLLLNKEASFMNIRKAMSQVVREAIQDDIVMFFFSGHGSIEEDRTYFLPMDANTDDLFASSIYFGDIVASANRLKDKECKVIIIMDACHSGALMGMKSAFELDMSAPGISILVSSTGNQQSKEYSDWRNGVFTKYLLDGLNGEASDSNGNITIDNLGFYVRKKVSEEDANQSPLYNNEQRNFILFKQ